MSKEINLEKLFNNNFDCYTEFGLRLQCIDEQPALTKDKFKEITLEFGKQLLELASENAVIGEKCIFNETWGENNFEIIIDKESILNTINQVKC